MSTFEDQPQRQSQTVLMCFAVAILVALLLVGSCVEIAYHRDQTSTLNGIEHERDELRKSNNSLREIVITSQNEQPRSYVGKESHWMTLKKSFTKANKRSLESS
ncbi:hypothetical protein NLN92_19440 [Citrobacter portucalensis]|uniref:hypothetical protein n=1 Tax=Citrobacter portucalensis TaxID=1639133 RepID=UPI00226B787C|nr:hypothetical protein [Citrobacter portucalensis]MCX8980183.1 hypothetical protein [Citrobacter portucalensis]